MNEHTLLISILFWTHECVWFLLNCTMLFPLHLFDIRTETEAKNTIQHKTTQNRTYFEYSARLFMLFHKRSDLFAHNMCDLLVSLYAEKWACHAMQSSACHAMGADFIFVIKMKILQNQSKSWQNWVRIMKRESWMGRFSFF